jgi:hypothetical protein
MKVQKRPLALGEFPYIDGLLRLNAHPLEGFNVGDRGDDQFARVLKPDESPIEQMVNAGSQEQAVLSIQALFV